jgi:hypothetical protein
MSKHGIFCFKPQPRLERRGQDGQRETEKPDHPASLGNSITSSTRTKFSVHTTAFSASSRTFDLNGEARTAKAKQSSRIIPPAYVIPSRHQLG